MVSGIIFIPSFAQNDAKEKALAALKKLSDKYKSSPYLSFDMTYRYADNDRPGKYLDSLKGSFMLNEEEYIYDLDNTEMINTKNYSITLFKEDKIMYLKKTSGEVPAANPVLMLDSFFQHNRNMECAISDADGDEKITLMFQPGLSYRKMEYYINRKTGYIEKAICVVDAKQMYDPAVQNNVHPVATESIIEVFFGHYQTGQFGKDAFDTSKYFKKEGDEYVAVAPYNAYKIFLGTPNL